jgi:hypothetical protein
MTGSKRAFLADSSSVVPQTGKAEMCPGEVLPGRIRHAVRHHRSGRNGPGIPQLIANSVIAFTHSA